MECAADDDECVSVDVLLMESYRGVVALLNGVAVYNVQLETPIAKSDGVFFARSTPLQSVPGVLRGPLMWDQTRGGFAAKELRQRGL